MVDLFLDNQKAVIKDNTTFKFNIDNQAFSQQGSYSFEIALPLMGCAANLNIFGSINRCESNLNKLTGTFRLVTEVITYEGKYKITSVSEEDVKVQLMSDKTLMNAESKDDKGDNIYIDELPLGQFLDDRDWYEDTKTTGFHEFNYPPLSMKDYAAYFKSGGMFLIHKIWGNNFLCFPIDSRVAEGSITANLHQVNNGIYELNTQGSIPGEYTPNIAIQPRLMEVVKRVFKSLGFEVSNELTVDGIYTYIANSRCKMNYTDILPHWTVNEFIKEVCNFFGAIILYDGSKARFINKELLFNGQMQVLDDVIDDYTQQISDEATDDYASSGNVDYDWPDEDGQLRLPDEIFDNADIKRYPNFTKLQEDAAKLSKKERDLSHILWIDDDTGNKYAFLQDDSIAATDNTNNDSFTLHRVDWYGPLLRDKSRDIQTTLRIVPVRMQAEPYEPKMWTTDVLTSDDNYSINDVIKPDSESAQKNEKTEKRDIIEVFYFDDWCRYKYQGVEIPLPEGVMLDLNKDTGLMNPIKYDIKNGAPKKNKLGPFQLQTWLEGKKKMSIDTHREYQFKFIKKGPIDINRPFLIRGKKYVCKQLQYDCSSTEVSPLIQGYFYAID